MKNRKLVPDYIENLNIYQAGKPIDELAREKNLTRISKLASNENPLGPSPFAIREMTNALWGVHRYPDMYAYEVKKSLSELYGLKFENIVLGNGSEGIMAYIVRAFILPGDEVLTAENTFIGFQILSKASGAKLVTTPRTKDHRYDVKAMVENIHEETRVIYIANPDNPMGTHITKEEFDYLMEYVPDHVIVILDEAYFEFARDHDDFPDSMNYRYDNVITLRTFSKAYGISGVRMGYGFAHENFIRNMHKVKLPFEPNTIAQKGAVGALKDQPHLERTLKNNREMYAKTYEFLVKHQFNTVPSITNFVTFETGSKEASLWLFEELLNLGVIIRPLSANGLPDFMRVSLGTPDEMEHFFEAMDNLMPRYNNKFKQ